MKKLLTGLVVVLIGAGILTPTLTFVTSNWKAMQNEKSLSEEKNNVPSAKDPDIPSKEDPDIPSKEDPKDIKATIEIHPHKINCKSNGKWITVYIGLSSSYDVQEIAIDTILLDNSLVPQLQPFDYVDINGDSNLGLMVKFDRAAFIEHLTVDNAPQQFNTITITGKLGDCTSFQGSCLIELLHYS
jgi:hypothetical protein